MYIRPMAQYEEIDVRRIFAACHPSARPLPKHWYFAHPTLVAIEGSTGGPIGFTSFSMNITENGRLGVLLHDCCVLPQFREQGIGRALMAKRFEVAREVGATFAGCAVTATHEKRLQTIRWLGFTEIARIAGGFTQTDPPEDAIVFIKDLES